MITRWILPMILPLVGHLRGQDFSVTESETIKQPIERRNCLFGFRFKNNETQPYIKINSTKVFSCDTSQPMPPCFVGNLLIVDCDFCTINISVTFFNSNVTKKSSSFHICMTFEPENIAAAVPTHGGPVVSNDSTAYIIAIVVSSILAIFIACCFFIFCSCVIVGIVYSLYSKGQICTQKKPPKETTCLGDLGLEAGITTESHEAVKDNETNSALITGVDNNPGMKQSSRDSHANRSFARKDDTLKENKKQDTPPVVPEVSDVNIQEDENLGNLSQEETPLRENEELV